MSKSMSPEMLTTWKGQVGNKVLKLKIDIENWQASVKRAQKSLKNCKKNLKLYEEELKRLDEFKRLEKEDKKEN